jgi:hypothetical protein
VAERVGDWIGAFLPQKQTTPVGRAFWRDAQEIMSLADACLVHMAELHPNATLLMCDPTLTKNTVTEWFPFSRRTVVVQIAPDVRHMSSTS